MIGRYLIHPFSTCLLLLLTAWTIPVATAAVTAPTVANQPSITAGVGTPLKLALDQFANIYLTDPRKGGINKYDRTGKWIATFAVPSPRAIAVTADQDLIVSRKQQVSVHDSNGNQKFTLQHPDGAFKYANGVAVQPTTGYIFVADSLDDCVLVFTATGLPVATGVAASGKPANSFGSSGSGLGQFALPIGLAFERQSGQLAVADALNGRIQFFDTTTWTHQKAIGSAGTGPLAFTFPEGVAFEYAKDASQSLSRMYVVDSYQSRIQAIDPAGSGTYLGSIGGYGRGTGKLITPSDIALDPTHNRLIVPNGLGSLAAFAINGGTIPPAVDITPPALTLLPATDIVTNQSNLVISGTVETGAVVIINTNTAATAGPVQYTPTASAGVTSWSATVTNLLTGVNALTVQAYDSANNPTTIVRLVDYQATAAVALTLAPVVTLTNTTTQLLSGTVESGATVTINGAPATLSGTGWNYPATLVNGLNSFTIVGSRTGRTSATITTAINVITTAPAMQVALPANASVVTGQLLAIRGEVTVDENFNQVTVALNGGAPQPVTVNSGTFALPVLLATGDNTILVTVTDKAGNSRSHSQAVTFDPGRQPISMTPTATTDGAVTAMASLDLTGTVTGATNVRLTFSQGGTPATVTLPVNDDTWSATGINLDPGLNIIAAQGLTAGGESISTTFITLTRVAPTMPAAAIATPTADLVTNNATLTVSGPAGAATVTATLNGTSLPVSFTPGAPGRFTLPVMFTTEGTYLLTITATDAFGNSVTTYRNIRYKVSAPAGFALTPFVGQPLTLAGTAEPGSTIHLTQSGGPALIAPVVVGTDGIWVITLPSGYDPATMNLFNADPAGNTTRNGDLSDDGRVDIVDALQIMRRAVGVVPLTTIDLLRADVGPYRNGVPCPDGVLDISDIVIVIEKILGLR